MLSAARKLLIPDAFCCHYRDCPSRSCYRKVHSDANEWIGAGNFVRGGQAIYFADGPRLACHPTAHPQPCPTGKILANRADQLSPNLNCRPLALAAGCEIAARNSCSVPTNLTNDCALVNAVYNSSRVDSGESSSGSTKVMRSN